MAQLETALNDPEIRMEAAEVLRGLISHIEVNPATNGNGVDAVLQGDLAEILNLRGEGEKINAPEVINRSVNSRWLRGREATYTELD